MRIRSRFLVFTFAVFLPYSAYADEGSSSVSSASYDSDTCMSALEIVLQNRIIQTFDPEYLSELSKMSEGKLRAVYPTFSFQDISNLKKLLDTPRLIALRKQRALKQIATLKEEHKKLMPALKKALDLRRQQTKADLKLVRMLTDYGLVGEGTIPPKKLTALINEKITQFSPSDALERIFISEEIDDVMEPILSHLALSAFRQWVRDGQGDFMNVYLGLPQRLKQSAMQLSVILHANNYYSRLRAFEQSADLGSIVEVSKLLLDTYYAKRFKSQVDTTKLIDLMSSQSSEVTREWSKSNLVVSSPSSVVRRVYPYIDYLRNQIQYSEYDEIRYFSQILQLDILADPTEKMLKELKDAQVVKEIALQSADPYYSSRILNFRGDTTGRIIGPAYYFLMSPAQASRDVFWGLAALMGWYQRPLE